MTHEAVEFWRIVIQMDDELFRFRRLIYFKLR